MIAQARIDAVPSSSRPKRIRAGGGGPAPHFEATEVASPSRRTSVKETCASWCAIFAVRGDGDGLFNLAEYRPAPCPAFGNRRC